MPRYRVTAPRIVVKTATPNGYMVVGLLEGSPLPDDVDADHARYLLDAGLTEVIPGTEAPKARPEPEPEPENVPKAEPAEAGKEEPPVRRAPAAAARAGDKK